MDTWQNDQKEENDCHERKRQREQDKKAKDRINKGRTGQERPPQKRRIGLEKRQGAGGEAKSRREGQ